MQVGLNVAENYIIPRILNGPIQQDCHHHKELWVGLISDSLQSFWKRYVFFKSYMDQIPTTFGEREGDEQVVSSPKST